VVVPYDSNTPSVVSFDSEDGNQLHFLGCCYVDGFMYGEAATWFAMQSSRH
jgi:hypothetical protein